MNKFENPAQSRLTRPGLALAAAILLAGVSPVSAGTSPGATAPWVTYEAENMKTTGLILGPHYDPNLVESESSGRKCVKLSAPGQSVEFTAQSAANAMVVRYSLPDSISGGGVSSSLSLYINGALAKKLRLTSKYSWLYGNYPFSNAPGKSPRNFYDEVRTVGLTIRTGDRIRLQKDGDDPVPYAVLDLVDLENVAPPLPRPAGGWLAITDPPYNATGDGLADDSAALQNCIADAVKLGKNVWVPAGTYLVTADINHLHDVTVQGAGMWHTTFIGDAALYASPNRRVRFNGDGSHVHLADFAIIGRLNYRNDNEANDGLGGFFGTGSSISRVWVEHTKTGAWIVNSSGLLINDCRIRDTVADGINLCVGVQNTIVTNCTTRGTGDDCFAMWPATYQSQTYVPGGNVFTHCTGELPFLANGGALYGGRDNQIEDCLFQDLPYGCGVLISGTFPVGTNVFGGRTVVQRCELRRCGGYDPSWQWRAAFQFAMENHPISNVSLSALEIIDSVSDGMSIIGSYPLSRVTASHLNIPNFGIGVPGRHGLWAFKDTDGRMDVNDSIVAEQGKDSARFAFNFVNTATSAKIIPDDSPHGMTNTLAK